MHAFTVTKQYFILLQLLNQTLKNSLTSHYCSPIQITVQEESEKWKLKFLLSLTSDAFVGGDLESPWCRCDSPESCSSWLICVLVCVCVWELSGCCAAVLLLWLVDTALTSLPRGCTSVDWDVCRTAVLELLSDFSQVKSPPLTPTASSSLSPLAVSLPLAAPVHVCPLSSPELGFFRLLCGVWGSSLLPVSWWSCGAERAQALVSQSQKN